MRVPEGIIIWQRCKDKAPFFSWKHCNMGLGTQTGPQWDAKCIMDVFCDRISGDLFSFHGPVQSVIFITGPGHIK